MASFEAKAGWETPRKRKKKNLSFRSVSTHPVIENSKKLANKLKKKLKKHHYGFFSSQNRLGKAEKERK